MTVDVFNVLSDFATELAVSEQRRVDCILVIKLEVEEQCSSSPGVSGVAGNISDHVFIYCQSSGFHCDVFGDVDRHDVGHVMGGNLVFNHIL